MSESEQKPAAQHAIDELSQGATSPEDQAVVEDWQRELDQQRASVVDGTKPIETLKQLPDGTLATESEVHAAQSAGQETPSSYDGSGRRA